ncbi:MAG TPA: metal ABC transporter substrate-binding protein [Anaerolineales bacterium]
MMGRFVQSWILIFFLVLALVSCSGGAAPDVLTTTTILADVARNVAGDRLTVGSLLPAGTDPHSYQPVPQDATMVERTKVLVVHGADYEGFLQPLLDSAGREKNVIEASKGARLLSDEQGNDPHLWLDPNNVIVYVDNIREGLTQFDPDGADVYEANASAYIDHLTELDAWINGQVAQIEPKRRVLVTNHEAFGYFAEHYGFIVVGAVIPGYSSDSAPSAQQMADLIEQIKLHEASAIFLDASDNPDLAKQIAAETGVKVISDLHLESLTEGAPAGTYIDMMRDNVTKIVQALQ